MQVWRHEIPCHKTLPVFSLQGRFIYATCCLSFLAYDVLIFWYTSLICDNLSPGY